MNTVEWPDGVYPDVPNQPDYQSHPSLSASGAKLLLQSPAKYRWTQDNPPERKPWFDFGTAVHTLVLTTGPEFAVIDAQDWRGKYAQEQRDKAYAEDKTPILAADFDKACDMEEAVRSHPIAGDLLALGDAEMSLFATDPGTGVRLRARPDWMTERDGRLWLVDLKTCQDANPATFGKTAHNYGYHIQAALYVYVAQLLELDEAPAFVFVCVEKEPPYLVSVVELDAEAFALGWRQMERAIGLYRDCQQSGEWPGYRCEITPVSLPPWAFRDLL